MLHNLLIRPVLLVFILFGLAACEVPVGGAASGSSVDPTKTVVVALLVPTGSSDEGRNEIGASLANAAKLAQSDLRGVTVDLKVYSTGGELAGATAAAEKAVADGAEIIVGPLFGDATTAVAPIASAAGLKVLSFSNNTIIAGGNVWLLGPTYENTAKRITGFAVSRGLTNIGIVHPVGIDGELGRDAIRTAAGQLSANVVAVGTYPLSVQGIADSASGIARQMRGAGANAILFTDGPTGGLPFVTETLRGLGVRANAVQFAGLQRWDVSSDALSQPGIQGGWFAAPDLSLTAQFSNRYEAVYGMPPHPLASLAYDGVAAVGALIVEAQQEKKRDPFSTTRLTNPTGYVGVNGVFRFTADGKNQRNLAIFEVREGEAKILDPAPRGFTNSGS